MRVGEARTPDDTRVYAIGDIHGCDQQLAEVHHRIAGDLGSRPVARHHVVHIGDYVDRGPNSAAVIERLVRYTADHAAVTCLLGNHDECLLAFLDNPARLGATYLSGNMGGRATLQSYGVPMKRVGWRANDYGGLARALIHGMPPAHRAFLDGLAGSVRIGDYFFCHAGIRPGVALARQDPEDLIWIREGFLDDEGDHGVVVVHGHTPVTAPDVRPNRINIDTGAVYGGRLTCLVLEGTGYRFL
jgi:serine/threonine protein phosphatase 1